MKKIILASIAIIIVIAAIFGFIIARKNFPVGNQPTPAPSPFWEQESYQTAKNKVIFDLPYKKDNIDLEYLPLSQAITASIETSDAETYRKSKAEAEKWFAKFNVNICDLHIYWHAGVSDKENLKPGDLTTAGCPSD